MQIKLIKQIKQIKQIKLIKLIKLIKQIKQIKHSRVWLIDCNVSYRLHNLIFFDHTIDIRI